LPDFILFLPCVVLFLDRVELGSEGFLHLADLVVEFGCEGRRRHLGVTLVVIVNRNLGCCFWFLLGGLFCCIQVWELGFSFRKRYIG